MKRRYYLRGLGIGIVFTSVFFLLTGNSNKTMSDEMIKARAKELGMIESTVLSQMPVDENVQETENSEEELTKSNEEETTSDIENEEEPVSDEDIKKEDGLSTVEEENAEDLPVKAVEEETSEIKDSSEIQNQKNEEKPVVQEVPVLNTTIANIDENTISIYVVLGEGSDSVSRRLQEAGLIPDALEYDKFLMQGGYDRRIAAGEHRIPVNASWEEIRDLICR